MFLKYFSIISLTVFLFLHLVINGALGEQCSLHLFGQKYQIELFQHCSHQNWLSFKHQLQNISPRNCEYLNFYCNSYKRNLTVKNVKHSANTNTTVDIIKNIHPSFQTRIQNSSQIQYISSNISGVMNTSSHNATKTTQNQHIPQRFKNNKFYISDSGSDSQNCGKTSAHPCR